MDARIFSPPDSNGVQARGAGLAHGEGEGEGEYNFAGGGELKPNGSVGANLVRAGALWLCVCIEPSNRKPKHWGILIHFVYTFKNHQL